jgi:hypothetical protein
VFPIEVSQSIRWYAGPGDSTRDEEADSGSDQRALVAISEILTNLRQFVVAS